MTRIRTTHVGSLPRGTEVAERLLDRESGAAFERASFDAVMAGAVAEVVQQQVDLGIDIVSDGETSKITYSTYVKDRLSGFDGDTPRQPALDLAPYPELRSRLAAAMGGSQAFRRQSCVGPITYVGHDDLHADLANLRDAVERSGADSAFMNAASPGLVSRRARSRPPPHIPSRPPPPPRLPLLLLVCYRCWAWRRRRHRHRIAPAFTCAAVRARHLEPPPTPLTPAAASAAALAANAARHAAKQLPSSATGLGTGCGRRGARGVAAARETGRAGAAAPRRRPGGGGSGGGQARAPRWRARRSARR